MISDDSELNSVLLQELARNRPKVIEKHFENQLCQQLVTAGHLPCKLSFRTEEDDCLNGCAYPDICLIGEDAMTPVVAIECKAKADLHSLTQALGQCLLYKQFAPLVLICTPTTFAIPSLIKKIAREQDIVIADGHNFGLFMASELERRNLKTLHIHLTDGVYIAPTKRIIVSLPRIENAA